jgi:hypothetical protein
MTDSRRIAGLIGPVIVVMTASETRLVDPHLYDNQIAPVVYLSGVLFFVAGLAIVRAHNRWTWGWPVLVTLGLLRMLFTSLYQRGAQNGDAMFVLELALVAVGAFLTFKAYWRPGTLRSSKGIEA